MAYQLGFDLYESATQQFLYKVKNLLKALVNIPQPMETETKPATEPGQAKEEKQETKVDFCLFESPRIIPKTIL
jgi:hypothetical protein